MDRIETVSSVWMGLTIGCARCHDHKYDPITQEEFYKLFAFFDHTPEPGNYRRSAPPTIKVPTRLAQRQLDQIDRELAQLEGDSDRHRELSEIKKKLWDAVPETMVMEDTQSRETQILQRGQYDKPGQRVTAGVPAALPAMPTDVPRNRLSLARWLVDPSHPLTARVMVNRIWQLHFGTTIFIAVASTRFGDARFRRPACRSLIHQPAKSAPSVASGPTHRCRRWHY